MSSTVHHHHGHAAMSWCTICELPRSHWICVACGKRDIANKRTVITARGKERSQQLAALERSIQLHHGALHAATTRYISDDARRLTRHHQQQSIMAALRASAADKQHLQGMRSKLQARRQQLHEARNELEHTKRSWMSVGQQELDDERQQMRHQLFDTQTNVMTKKKDHIALLLKIYSVRRYDDRHCTIVDIMVPDQCSIIDERADGHAVAAAMGYIVFVLQLVAHYLDVTLPIAMFFCGARSYMHDVTGVAPPHIVDAKWYLCFDDDPNKTTREDESAVDAGHEYSDHRTDTSHHHHSGHGHHRHASSSGGSGSHHPQGASAAAASSSNPNNSPSSSTNNARVVTGSGNSERERRGDAPAPSMADIASRLESFRRAMSLLDHNMRYLCAKQNLPRDAIRSHYFLPNLLLLIESVQNTSGLDMLRIYDGPLIASNGSISGSDTDSVNSPHAARLNRVSSGGAMMTRVDSATGLARVDSGTRMAAESFQMVRPTMGGAGHAHGLATTPIPEHLQAHHPLVWMRPSGPQLPLISPPSGSGHGHSSSSSSLDSPTGRVPHHQHHNSGGRTHGGSGTNLAAMVPAAGAARTSSSDTAPTATAGPQQQQQRAPQFALTVHDSHFSMPVTPSLRPNGAPHPSGVVVTPPPQQRSPSPPAGPSLTIPNPVAVVGNFLQSLPSVVGSVAAKDGPPPPRGGTPAKSQPNVTSPFVRMGGGSGSTVMNGNTSHAQAAHVRPNAATGAPSPFISAKAATPPTAHTNNNGLMDDDDDWALIDNEHLHHSTIATAHHHHHVHPQQQHRPAAAAPSVSSSRPAAAVAPVVTAAPNAGRRP